MIDYKIAVLFAGTYVAIFGCYVYVQRRSNHTYEKLDKLKDDFNNFRVEATGKLSEIDAQVKQLLKFNMTKRL